MTQTFWDGFWANLLSSLSVLVIVSVVGYLAKAKIILSVKKFISDEVTATVKQVEDLTK